MSATIVTRLRQSQRLAAALDAVVEAEARAEAAEVRLERVRAILVAALVEHRSTITHAEPAFGRMLPCSANARVAAALSAATADDRQGR
ncbi:hypothetical protein SAMN04489867_3059 [Pedococcus dokdonensis]|uniref:Uncharacterized protein n=1 Tax=Pedococcus dokdonensis TaxID=443156 RepID=A0A1H0U013_9MICO|nr:hypothetical protein [Pedococcus dokdonensis]SDP59494.1 hypothetical protein SAMN04489867_3059 [Pedococcus dokdonensis]